MSYAMDNGQMSCIQAIKACDGEATYADRTMKMKELTERLMNEFPDYKQSIFKHPKPKITLFGKKISRREIENHQQKMKQHAEELKN